MHDANKNRFYCMLLIRLALITACMTFIGLSDGNEAAASFVTYATPSGSTESGGQPVNASASFTITNGAIHIDLGNLQVDQKAVAQNVSDLLFTINTGQNSGTIAASSGLERTINSGGSYTNGSTVATGWSLSTSGSALYLNVLGTAIGPAHTLVGLPNASNLYANANGSIAGNGPHNPFLAGTISFDLLVPGVTADSTISSAIFSFGTAAGNNVAGTVVPIPAAVWLFGSGLAAMMGLARRRAKNGEASFVKRQ